MNTRKLTLATASLALLLLATLSLTFVAKASDTPEYFTEVIKGRTITYEVINGYAVVQGDMVIGEAVIKTGADGRRTASLRSVSPNSLIHRESNTVQSRFFTLAKSKRRGYRPLTSQRKVVLP